MRVIRIRYKNENGEEINPETAELIKGKGIKGDVHKQTEDRDISLLDEVTSKNIRKSDGLCTKRFRENITICGDTGSIKAGDIYDIGTSKIRITKKGKECFENCPLVKEGTQCGLSGNIIFAGVEKGGAIRTGMLIRKV